METAETKIKLPLEADLPIPDPEGVEFEELTPEEQERLVLASLERNAEVLRGLAKR